MRGELGQLFVHRNRLDRESGSRVRLTHFLEIVDCLLAVSYARVKIANGIEDSKVLGIYLHHLFVFGDGVLQLAPLDVLFRGSQNLHFVEPETKGHFLKLLKLQKNEQRLCQYS